MLLFWIKIILYFIVSIQEVNMDKVTQWSRYEREFLSSENYDNPVQDVRVEVDFISPSDQKHTILGFWDGAGNWKVRFSPDETGEWTYQSRCPVDSGLDHQTGAFDCIPYTGDNSLYQHGFIKLSDNGYHLKYADGDPFFWLGDTAWNGPLLSSDEDWDTYLQDRVSKGFTVIQFIATHWRAGLSDADGRLAFMGKEKIEINPKFYQRLDKKINVLNDYGLVAAPVLIWTCTADDPGQILPDDQITLLAQYMVARYGSHHVIWILGGDGRYTAERAERWKKIGRIVFGENPDRLATMHPGGRQWVGAEFRNENWFSFIGYQSGHRMDESGLRWSSQGPPAQDWMTEPHCPVINLEPNYEAHRNRADDSDEIFDAHAVRRAAYWSLLVSPCAGVTYGAHGIWSWQSQPAEPLAHRGTGIAPKWSEALNLPGSADMKILKDFFLSLNWWELFPAQEMLIKQAGDDDPLKFVAVAKSENDTFAVVYTPSGGVLSLRTSMIKSPAKAQWFNPRTGEYVGSHEVIHQIMDFTAPDSQDWVLLIAKSE
jgi:hypothetical protein